MKAKFIIVDDEPLARKLIAAHASKIEKLELVGECGNAIDAANLLRTKSVDLIFLDIQMPEMNGFQFVSTLKNPPAIILTTAFRNYAPETFDHEVIDYLLKPVSFERFLKSVNKFFDSQIGGSVVTDKHQGDRFVLIKADRKIHKINEDEIFYFESMDNYVKVHVKDQVLITHENISTLEEKLSNPPFVRIHRSFIVNLKWVNTISGEGIEINKKALPFGRTFKKSALNQLSIGRLK